MTTPNGITPASLPAPVGTRQVVTASTGLTHVVLAVNADGSVKTGCGATLAQFTRSNVLANVGQHSGVTCKTCPGGSDNEHRARMAEREAIRAAPANPDVEARRAVNSVLGPVAEQ